MVFDTTGETFTALLCGTAGEKTSCIFVQHILSLHPSPHIIILDIGAPQIEASTKAVQSQFPEAHVTFINADARSSRIEAESIDFIDTDFMFEYLDDDGVRDVLSEWKRILKPGGCFAFRVFAYRNALAKAVITLGGKIIGRILQSDTYPHQYFSLHKLLTESGMHYHEAGTVCPLGYKFIGKKPILDTVGK